MCEFHGEWKSLIHHHDQAFSQAQNEQAYSSNGYVYVNGCHGESEIGIYHG